MLGALGVSLLGNLLISNGTIKSDQDTVRATQKFQCGLIHKQLFKYKDIFKMNPNLMTFIQEITYLK